MEKTDDYIANRLIWKASKYSLPTKSSFYYKDLLPDIQVYLSQFINIESSGVPVIFFTKPSKEWTLVCTRQVICNDNKSVFKINISDIESFKPTALENFTNGQTIDIEGIKKAEWHQVTIVDKSMNSYVLYADSGTDLFALWNILLMAANLYN